jgi:mannose/fructose/N-acetylgalactosamine-specific phosphotransferase system component IIC
MFFNWISAVAGGMAIWFAVAEGKKFGDDLIGLGVGLAVGFCCFMVMKTIVSWLPQRLGLIGQKTATRSYPRFRTISLWLLLISAVIWLFISAFLGSWVTRLTIHLL